MTGEDSDSSEKSASPGTAYKEGQSGRERLRQVLKWIVLTLVVFVIHVNTFITKEAVQEHMGTKESDPIQFRPQELGEALDLLKEQRIEGINVSKLAREGLREMLRQITTGDEKARIFSMYQRGEIDEDVARVYLGEALDTMEADAAEIEAAVEDDTSELLN